MSDTFIGRRAELRVLEQAVASAASGFIPIYGRRRVGKSELILHFLRGQPGLYYLGKQAPAAAQIREFLQTAAAVLGQPLLATYPAESWQAAIEAVQNQWRGSHKLILVLDEFQWLAAASPELPSTLQQLWDRQWRDNGKILLVLCGSYLGFMEREVLGQRSPLFGRRTAQILLQPFGYREAGEFHPDYSRVDKARTYFLCGGVPLYLKCFKSACSVETNIARNFLDEFATLYREPDFLLREELREVDNYYVILLAIAAGFNTNRDIARQTGIGERNLHYYLQQLLELGYLARRYPLSDGPPVARQVRYILEDPMLRFWFRFVYPNTSLIAQRGGEQTFKDRIAPELDAWFGGGFERLCREAMPRLYAREGVQAPFEVGEYWDPRVQIDLIGKRDDGWTDVWECKWGTVRSPGLLLKELQEKITHYPNRRNATLGLRLFTRQTLSCGPNFPSQVRCHDLASLYAD